MDPSLALVSETFENGEWTSIFHHTESIYPLVKGLSQDDFLTVIHLAASALTHLQTSSEKIQYKEALEKEIQLHTLRIKEASQKAYDALLFEKESDSSKTTIEINRLKAMINELQIKNDNIQSQFAELHSISQETFNTNLNAMRAEKDEQYSKEITRMREETKERIEEIKKIYSENDLRIKKESAVSSEIGKKGELDFEELVAQYTKWGALRKTSKIAHNADWGCNIRKCNTLFEVKNYSDDIPLREITKFEEDIKSHGEVHFGVFISLNTELQGKRFKNDITIDWTSKSQMLIYVSSLRSQDIKSVFLFLDMCSDIAYRYYMLANDRPDDSQECIRLQSQIQTMKILIDKEFASIADWLRDIKTDHKNAVELLNKNHVLNVSRITHMKTTFLHMFEVIGQPFEEPSEPPVSSIPPVAPPKKRSSKKVSESS